MNWLTEFRPYTLQHVMVALAWVAVIAVFCRLGYVWRKVAPKRERLLRCSWVVVLLAANVYSRIWWSLPEHFTLSYGLPLHICDLTVWLAPFALLSSWRWARALGYFWGIGLSLQSFIFPPITQGPDSIRFWLYWIVHVQIVGTAAYIPAGLGFRPTLSDVRTAALAILAYDAIIFPIDLIFTWDYGYLGPVTTVVGWLGPWPRRAFILVALQLTSFILLWLPWRNRPEARERACGA